MTVPRITDKLIEDATVFTSGFWDLFLANRLAKIHFSRQIGVKGGS